MNFLQTGTTRKQTSPHHVDLIGNLPKAFIGVAFFNFLIGAGLGGWMASSPTTWSMAGPIHGEINPFGWLTMLIYGMTYAVLSIATGIRPPKSWVGWLHLVLSEVAVVVVVAALLTHGALLFHIGLGCQFAAPVVFLVNILSAVFSARRERNKLQNTPFVAETAQSRALAFLRRSDKYQATDRIAQRGTDVSLMLFVVGAGWMWLKAFGQHNPLTGGASPRGALFLVYYGWIAGTVFAVSLHLFPRFVGSAKFNAKAVAFGQAIWGLAVLIWALGSVWSVDLVRLGNLLLGVSLVWLSAVYLRALFSYRTGSVQGIDVPRTSIVAWSASWTFCLALGLCLIWGLDGLSLAAMHLLFLGFATTLVYGVGYTLFPLMLRRKQLPGLLTMAQVALAIIGALLMVIAFLSMLSSYQHAFVLLGIGGTCAAVSAFVFVLQWPLSKRA